jgi:acyl-CoA thioesterase
MNDAQVLAEQVAAAMIQRDHVATALGMALICVSPGRATITMRVRQEMVNGHDLCHGGMIFTLADTAFAYACNSYNQVAVAASASIEFLRPGRLGDLLSADATEVVRTGRGGVYDVVVTNQNGDQLALFRGKAAQIGGVVAPPA